MKHLYVGVMAALFFASVALAHGVTAGNIEIIHPHIPQPPASAKSAAGYMGISNNGTDADRLIGVEISAAASAMLHTTTIDENGVAKMGPLEAVDIPAGGTVVLEPGAIHLMLMGLTMTLAEGDMMPATLIFEHAGRVEVEFMVDPPGQMDHSKMHHAGHGASN